MSIGSARCPTSSTFGPRGVGRRLAAPARRSHHRGVAGGRAGGECIRLRLSELMFVEVVTSGRAVRGAVGMARGPARRHRGSRARPSARAPGPSMDAARPGARGRPVAVGADAGAPGPALIHLPLRAFGPCAFPSWYNGSRSWRAVFSLMMPGVPSNPTGMPAWAVEVYKASATSMESGNPGAPTCQPSPKPRAPGRCSSACNFRASPTRKCGLR